jgi:DNA-binding LacI/PurR family transcriptional regulator
MVFKIIDMDERAGGMVTENSQTKCEMLTRELSHLIESGEYRPHQKFFSVVQLMRRYQVSQGTVTETLKRLELAGLIYRRPSSGTFISPPQKVRQILLVARVNRIENEELNAFLYHMEQGMSQQYSFQVTYVSEREFLADLDYLDIVYRHTVGVIFFRTPKAYADSRDFLDGKNITSIFYGSSRHREELGDIGCYYYDEKVIVDSVLDYLYARGHRKIGCVYYDEGIFAYRKQLYVEWMIEHGLFIDARSIFRGEPDKLVYPQICAMKKSDFDCTALFAIHFRQGMEAVQALLRIGVEVPGDISVVTIGHSRNTEFFHPQLTSLSIDHNRDADLIVGQLAAAIERRQVEIGGDSRIEILEGESVRDLT